MERRQKPHKMSSVPFTALVAGLTLLSLSSFGNGQPFLNSLAVLFRARPPWPTSFPSGKFTPIPPPLIHQSSSNAQQGILVAHPIDSSSSTAYESINSGMKSKQPDTIGTVVQLLTPNTSPPVPSPQQNFIPMPSTPTVSPPVPVFPPPIPFFQNGQLVVGVPSQSQQNHGGSNIRDNINNNNQHNQHNTNSEVLIASPTTLVGNVAERPTTVPNPHYGVLLENTNNNNNNNNNNNWPNNNNNNNKIRNKKQRFQENAWNPVAVSTHNENNRNYGYVGSNNGNNNNHNKQSEDDDRSKNSSTEKSRKEKKIKDFRPSPQLNSFVETTMISDYGNHMNYNGPYGNSNDPDNKQSSNFQPSEARHPRLESGFRPISYDQYAAQYGSTATRSHYTNSHQQYYNPWSIAFNNGNNNEGQQQGGGGGNTNTNNNNNKHDDGDGEYETSTVRSSKGTRRGDNNKPFRHDRQIIPGSPESHNNPNDNNNSSRDESLQEGSSSSEEGKQAGNIGNRGKKNNNQNERKLSKDKSRHRFSSRGKNNKQHNRMTATISSTTASSELVEEWLPPDLRIQKKSDNRRKFPIFNNRVKPLPKLGTPVPKGIRLPEKCEKFNRFGFCPVTKQYPLDAAEKIAARCTALMSHLIAPLPKMDVKYDTVAGDGRNGTKDGRLAGWSWKSFQGKPVCPTDELAILPGWARNEKGDWLIILQTKMWQQKAHITLCSPVAVKCQGLACPPDNNNKSPQEGRRHDDSLIETKPPKCVQRFSAQRLAVFDPEDPDRCPVVHSVFLPSACVCLTSGSGPTEGSKNSLERGKQSSKYSQFSPRQALFTSNEEDTVRQSESDEYPADSREALLVAKESWSRAAKSVERANSRESLGKEHEHKDSMEVLSSPPSNATFMIITEKFSTSESSKETKVLDGRLNVEESRATNETLKD